MTEIRPIAEVALAPNAGAVSGTANEATAPALPRTASAPATRHWSSEEVQRWIEHLNRSWEGERIGFGLVQRLHAMYVQVYDRATGKVLREFPPKEFLERQAALAEMIGVILNKEV